MCTHPYICAHCTIVGPPNFLGFIKLTYMQNEGKNNILYKTAEIKMK